MASTLNRTNSSDLLRDVERSISQQQYDNRLAHFQNRIQAAVMKGAFIGGALGALLAPSGGIEVWCGASIGTLLGASLLGVWEIHVCYREETTPIFLFHKVYPRQNED